MALYEHLSKKESGDVLYPCVVVVVVLVEQHHFLAGSRSPSASTATASGPIVFSEPLRLSLRTGL